MKYLTRGIWVVAYRELLRFIADRSRMISSFAFPLMFLVVIGAGFNRIVGELSGDLDFIDFIYPGVIAMTVVMSSLFSGLSVVWDREFGFLKVMLVAPLSRSGIVIGKAVGGSAAALGQGIIMLALAPVLGISLTPLLVAKFILIVLLLSLTLSGLGILIATRMRSQQGFHMVTQLLVFPLIFLSGVFYPVDHVPTWLQVIAKVNPLSYGVDGLRQILLGGKLHSAATAIYSSEDITLGLTLFGHRMGVVEDALVVGVLGFALMAAAVWSFSRQE
jgi:ABC-2 type transport system permease protein